MTTIIGSAPLTFERAKRAIKALRHIPRRVLDAICQGEQPTMHPLTERALLRNGLVSKGQTFRPASETILRAWREVCAEEGGE